MDAKPGAAALPAAPRGGRPPCARSPADAAVTCLISSCRAGAAGPTRLSPRARAAITNEHRRCDPRGARAPVAQAVGSKATAKTTMTTIVPAGRIWRWALPRYIRTFPNPNQNIAAIQAARMPRRNHAAKSHQVIVGAANTCPKCSGIDLLPRPKVKNGHGLQ